MNIPEIDRTIEKLRKTTTFYMPDFFHSCGTPGCIAGHVIGSRVEAVGANPSRLASDMLGIPREVGANLFTPFHIDYLAVTVPIAIQALENLKAGATTEKELWPDFYQEDE